jgi:hypothetical protein
MLYLYGPLPVGFVLLRSTDPTSTSAVEISSEPTCGCGDI